MTETASTSSLEDASLLEEGPGLRQRKPREKEEEEEIEDIGLIQAE